MSSSHARLVALTAALTAALPGVIAARQQTLPPGSVPAESLALHPKEAAATVVSKSGIGTATAIVEARITRKDFQEWCDNWQPDNKKCVEDSLKAEGGKTYRVTADCRRGRITTADGERYTWAARGTSRDGVSARFRDAAGKLVTLDNASGGFIIPLQWDLVCPGWPKALRITPPPHSRHGNIIPVARARRVSWSG